jgi:hypothetical protein
MRLTLVNGVTTFDGRAYTGARPGEYLVPTAAANDAKALEAAE